MKEIKWEWVIQSNKQDNGLYGMPFSCYKLDGMPILSNEDEEVLRSAIIISIAEAYPDDTFEIFWSTTEGFFVKLNNNGFKKIRFSDYTLENNILRWKK